MDEISKFLSELLKISVICKDSIFKNLDRDTAVKIAETKINDTKRSFCKHTPTDNDIKSEIYNDTKTNLYDGFELQRIMSSILYPQYNIDDTLHIIFTDRLACTFDLDDFRYHARTLIAANPSIISTTGMIEAPARSREFYLDLWSNPSTNILEIEEKYKKQFLTYNDSRLGAVAKGYALQAVIYYMTGDAFCDQRDCQMYNAHWQSELLHCLVENNYLCKKHKEMIIRLQKAHSI